MANFFLAFFAFLPADYCACSQVGSENFPAEQKVPGHTLSGKLTCEEGKRAEEFHDNSSVPRVFPSGSLSSEKLASEKVRFCALNVSSSPLGTVGICNSPVAVQLYGQVLCSANVVFYVAMQCSLLCLHGCLTESRRFS